MPALSELPATLVVDASVGLKWVVNEAGSEAAVGLIAGRRLIVPDLFWIETGNALSAKVRRQEFTRAQASDAWRDLRQAPVTSVPCTPDSLAPSLSLAQDLSHPIYDCIYLALAIGESCIVVTADRRFVEAVDTQPNLAGCVLLLDDIVLGGNLADALRQEGGAEIDFDPPKAQLKLRPVDFT